MRGGMAVALMAATTMLWGQQNAVVSETSGSRVYLEMSLPALQSNLDTLFARSAQASSLTWSDVLANGGSPGVDVAFNGFSASGIGDLAASGTVTADSLVLNKDADLLGRLSITGVTQLEDSLRVAGFVEFADSLRVLKAVAIGETLHVSGLTTLGDSLHVTANVDFDALFNVDGDATFGGSLDVVGLTTLVGGLTVQSDVEVAGDLTVDNDFTNFKANGEFVVDAHFIDLYNDGHGQWISEDDLVIGTNDDEEWVDTGDEDDIYYDGDYIYLIFDAEEDYHNDMDVLYSEGTELQLLSSQDIYLNAGDESAEIEMSSEDNAIALDADSVIVTSLFSARGAMDVDGNAEFNAELKVDGDATFGGTIHADSIVVADVINGRVSSLSNLTSDELAEGEANLYFTAAERVALAQLMATVDSLIAVINGSGDAPETAFSCGNALAYQGYDYTTVQIGEQCWFAEDLQSLLYNDDEAIPSDLDATAWNDDVLGAVAVYNGDENNAALRGRLYNWYAVETGKLCPAGWHVPSDEEWKVLEIALGMSPVDADGANFRGTDQGARMKSSDSGVFNWNGSNSSGLSVLPNGYRAPSGSYEQADSYGALWASTSSGSGSWARLLALSVDQVYRGSNLKGHGFSVRCMLDQLD